MSSDDDLQPASPSDFPHSGAPQWTSEFDGVDVGRICHIQRAESRFGAHVTEDIKNFVFEDVGGGTLNPMDFDDDDEEVVEEELDSDDDDIDLATLFQPGTAAEQAHAPETSEALPSFPKMARLRCNLTALSQRYNLYFAAYQDKIYVYQPKAPPEILPGPSITLQPKQTRAGRMFGGVIDRVFPHQINNMLVGNLGKLEVILLAYDDGDVVAYYTHTIVSAILTNLEQTVGGLGIPGARLVIPKPFFHENVGQSAWGVAVHEKSRLLAVSSNHHEVTVFAFAVNRVQVKPESSEELDTSPKVWSGQTAIGLERHFQSRTRTWRVVLPTGQQGHNIPTIAFADNEFGESEKVVALDINDNTWILDIWKIGNTSVVYRGSLFRGMGTHARSVGWGVLVLPDSSFMHVKSVREAVGVPADQILMKRPHKTVTTPGGVMRPTHDTWLDTTCSLYYVKDLASVPEQDLRVRYGPSYSHMHAKKCTPKIEVSLSGDEQSQDEMDYDPYLSDHLSESESEISGHDDDQHIKDTETKAKLRWATLSEYPGPKGSAIDDLDSEIHLGRAIVPSFGQTTHLDGSFSNLVDLVNGAPRRQNKSREVDLSQARLSEYMMKNVSILRATTTDFELLSLDTSASVQCKSALTYHNHHRRRAQPYDLAQHISERISMLLHVPELNLVVAGALNGRVALITLTKTKATVHGQPLRRGFRLDYVLPRKQEEEKRLRPWCTLHGIAMSPVPGRHIRGLKGLQLMDDDRPGKRHSRQPLPFKYRLILHYLDHTILMYDIERKGHDLLIF
ncbi:hypothetical protein V8F20_003051 [Naviculisporaceae sp. PSN 640]